MKKKRKFKRDRIEERRKVIIGAYMFFSLILLAAASLFAFVF